MRIVALTAENVKRLKAVEITPTGDVVVIAGKNAQGKSSVLDAIWMALAGAAATKDTTRPIRDGEKKAMVTLDLGDLLVVRKWTASGTTLEVSTKVRPDGRGENSTSLKFMSPQAVLDSLIGRLTFDPLAFAGQDAKGQLATLLEVVDLPFDPASLAVRRKECFDGRTDVNRDVRTLEAQLESLAPPREDTPGEELSAAAIVAEIDAGTVVNRRLDEFESMMEGARSRLAEAKDAAAREEAEIARLEAIAPELPEAVDVAGIRERLSVVDETNARVRDKNHRARIAGQLEAQRRLAETLTAELERIDQEKADGLAAARMPLDGLSFDEDGVLYNGVPFGQCSAAERLRVGIAVAMALNPKIRVIRITDGSLLDSENMALIEKMAGENDFQVWLERVDETGSVGITIEDGMVADPIP